MRTQALVLLEPVLGLLALLLFIGGLLSGWELAYWIAGGVLGYRILSRALGITYGRGRHQYSNARSRALIFIGVGVFLIGGLFDLGWLWVSAVSGLGCHLVARLLIGPETGTRPVAE
jgi:hypothetical protein